MAGTRPEAIKLAPIVIAARSRAEFHHLLIATGQHGALFDDALAVFDLMPDLRLPAPRRRSTIAAAARHIRSALRPVLIELAPDLVIVQGDTTSAWAAALAARDARVPIAHVEAGLRSGDPLLPWPEERNRIAIDAIADLLFAPTVGAAINLRREQVGGHIAVTGNSGIDALLQASVAAPALLRDSATRHLLVTCHRRENLGAALDRICAALCKLSERTDLRITVPLHPNPAAGEAMRALLAGCPRVTLVPPLDYRAMIAALKASDLVLSDSGGLQEECPALGLPLLVLRDNSERPEAVDGGNARLIGTETQAIVDAVTRLLDDGPAYARMARPAFPFGDGAAAMRMLDAIALFPFAPGP